MARRLHRVLYLRSRSRHRSRGAKKHKTEIAEALQEETAPAALPPKAPGRPIERPVVTMIPDEELDPASKAGCARNFLEDPVTIPILRVPVFPVYGERTWDDDKQLWQGVVRKGTPVQKLVNLSFMQLGERLVQAPKVEWLTTPEAVENYEDGYKNSNKTLNPLLLYNDKSEDGKVTYEKPERFEHRVEFGDLTGIISSNLELMASITGVDSKGVFDDKRDITATEVLSQERQVQTSIRHFFDNLRQTFKSVGETLCDMLEIGPVSLEVVQGPEENLQRQVARAELLQLAGIVPDTQKKFIVNGILKAFDDNEILSNVYNELNAAPEPTAMEMEMQQTIEQMKQAIEERDAKMAEMQKQIDYYEKSDADAERSIQAQFAQMDLEHQQELEKMAFQAELDAGADARKERGEAVKQELEIEKQAVQLDAARNNIHTQSVDRRIGTWLDVAVLANLNNARVVKEQRATIYPPRRSEYLTIVNLG